MRPPSTTAKENWPPDYVSVFAWRQAQLLKLRASPVLLAGAKEFYRANPAAFINHWCVTYDPRNAGSEVPTALPLVMFERQDELVGFLYACLKGEANGLVEKSRDMGATWVCCAFTIWLWIFWEGAAIGWGSRDQSLVDEKGIVDSIFEKMRVLIRGIPREFLPAGFSTRDHMPFMRILNPGPGASTITGGIGDNIGRGGRTLIYFKDESAHYVHPELIEAALSANTRVQIDISSVHGLGNVFHRKREAGVEYSPGMAIEKSRTYVFVMDWRDHPAKSQEWYDRERAEKLRNGLLHVFAQEVDRNYSASVEGVIIPGEWVKAAIDAHVKLGFDDSGGWVAGLDVADGGGDRNALAKRKGSILKSAEEWGERDTGITARRAVSACEGLLRVDLQYDSIGVGAGVKAETNRLSDEGLLPKGIYLVPWGAAEAALDPDGRVEVDDDNSPLNKDFYANLKAQGWWRLRRRFEQTWRAINEPGFTWKSEDLISLPSDLPALRQIEKELSQAVVKKDAKMRLVVDKSPEGTKSPNIADAIVMAFWPKEDDAVTLWRRAFPN